MLSITNPQVEERRKPFLSPPESRRAQERGAHRVAAPATDGFVADEFVERVYATLDRPTYGRSSRRVRVSTSSRVAVIVLTILLAAAWYGYPRFREYVRRAGHAAGIEISLGEVRSDNTWAE